MMQTFAPPRPCTAQLTSRSAPPRSSFGCASVVRTAFMSKRQQVRKVVVAANPISDVGKYLGDAAKQIFSPQNTADQPPWAGSGGSFSGSISHHEDSTARLRALYTAVQRTRESITGCTDPNAANFDPAAVVDDGTCNYIADTTEETGVTEDLRGYISNTIGRVFSSNFKGDATEPSDWASMGYSYRGERVSHRDVSRLLQYEKFVKKALDEAEADEKKQ